MRIPGGGESLIADGMRSLGANRLTSIATLGRAPRFADARYEEVFPCAALASTSVTEVLLPVIATNNTAIAKSNKYYCFSDKQQKILL